MGDTEPQFAGDEQGNCARDFASPAPLSPYPPVLARGRSVPLPRVHVSSAPWQGERAGRLHRFCKAVERRRAAGMPMRKAAKYFAWFWRDRHYRTAPHIKAKFSRSTLVKLYYVWRRNAKSPDCFRLHYGDRLAPVTAGEVRRFTDACARADTVSISQAARLAGSEWASGQRVVARLPAWLVLQIKRVFTERRHARREARAAIKEFQAQMRCRDKAAAARGRKVKRLLESFIGRRGMSGVESNLPKGKRGDSELQRVLQWHPAKGLNMGDEREFKIKITGDATSLVGATQQSQAALKGLANQTTEAAPTMDQLGQKTEESAKSSEHAGISHRALHLIFRQVGEASKGLEVGLMGLAGVMMGSVTFGIYAVVAGIKALIAHFEKQREIALEAAKATVQFWTDALKGKEDAIKAAKDYATALDKIITNVNTLKQKEAEEEAVLKRVVQQRLNILDAERQAEIAAAKGDKGEEARINARYGQRKSDVELQEEQAEIALKKRHLEEQAADAANKERAAAAAEKAKEAGAPGRSEASDAEARLTKLPEELAKLQAARMKPADLEALRAWVAKDVELVKKGDPSILAMAAFGIPQAKAGQLKKANEAEQAYSAAQQEYEQSQADIERFKTGTAALAKAAADALGELNRAIEAARSTSEEITKAAAVHGVNVDAAETIRRIKEGGVIRAAGVPDNALSRSVLSDINAMEGVAQGQRMDPQQTAMVNHLMALLRAQGANAGTINTLLIEMKNMHIDQDKKLEDIWGQLKQVQGQAARVY